MQLTQTRSLVDDAGRVVGCSALVVEARVIGRRVCGGVRRRTRQRRQLQACVAQTGQVDRADALALRIQAVRTAVTLHVCVRSIVDLVRERSDATTDGGVCERAGRVRKCRSVEALRVSEGVRAESSGGTEV